MLKGPWDILEERTDWRGVTLYRARHGESGNEFLLEELALASPARDRIYHEIALGIEKQIDLAKTVEHPALRKPLGVTRHNDRYLMVRDNDAQLWEAWGRTPDPGSPDELGRWLTVMAEVLAVYHQAGLAARGPARSDLVPAGDSILVLEPFCESYLAGYRDREQYQRYELAPEAIKGKEWDRRADLFILGMNAYLLASGRLPFEGSGAVLVDNVLSQKIIDPRAFRPNLGSALAGSIVSLLARDPARRPEISTLLSSLEDQRSSGGWTDSSKPRKKSGRLGRRAGYLARRERLFGLMRRNRIAVLLSTLAVTAVVLLIVFRGKPPAPVITGQTSPLQVVEAYYHAIDSLDQGLLQETLAPKVGDDAKNMVISLYVMSRTRMAYEMQEGKTAEDFKQLDLEDLEIKRTGQEPPEFTAHYRLVLHKGDVDEIVAKEDWLRLERRRDKRAGEKWVIGELREQELDRKEVPHPLEEGDMAGASLEFLPVMGP